MQRGSLSVVVVAMERVFDSSLAMTLDVLATAGALRTRDGTAGAIHTTVAAAHGDRVRTRRGLEVPVEAALEDIARCDLVILPGLGVGDPHALSARLARPDAQLVTEHLARLHARGATLAASCSSVFLLAETGALAGAAATTTWWLAGAFRARFPDVDLRADRVLTIGPRTMCAGAAMAQADLMLAIVERHFGEGLAQRVSSTLLIDRREVQSRYVLSELFALHHPDVARAREWVIAHMDASFSIGELARGLGMSERTLARRIKAGVALSPSRFVQSVRAEHAAHLLRTSGLTVEEVAHEVGYEDASSLRRLLERHYAATPSQLRKEGGRVTSR